MDPVRRTYVLPTGEGRVALEPTALAWRISGLELEDDGSLRTVYGYATWEHNYNYLRPHGIVHGFVDGREVLLLAQGSRIYRHTGWGNTYEVLTDAGDSLSDDAQPTFAGQFALVSGQFVYCAGNGVDSLRSTRSDGWSGRIGFPTAPTPPGVDGPSELAHLDVTRGAQTANSEGYSWPGNVGTVGDEISIEEAKLLAGAWFYHVQWEDHLGNLSALSGPSNPAVLYSQTTVIVDAAGEVKNEQIDDILRQFVLRVDAKNAPRHAAAIRIYRTPDTRNTGTSPQLLVRYGGTGEAIYPDSRADADLGLPALPVVPLPTPKVICAHQGALAIGNLPGEPGKIMLSEYGFPGTYRSDRWAVPDESGEVTGLASFRGMLVAFSPKTVRIVRDDMRVEAIPTSDGCVCPTSVQELAGSLIWLGSDGVYAFDGAEVRCITEELREVFSGEINQSLARSAKSAVVAGTYYLALPRAGSTSYSYMLAWTPERGWREFDLPWSVLCMTTVRDREYLLLGVATSRDYQVLVWDHAHYLYDYDPVGSYYRSGWLRSDDAAVGDFRVKNIYVRLLESWAGVATIRFFKDGEYADQVGETQTFYLAADQFQGADDYDNAGDMVIGVDRVKRPTAVWRRIPTPVDRCHEFQFEIASDYPIHIAGFAFDLEKVSGPYGSFQGKGV